MRKILEECLKECLSKANNYCIDFPPRDRMVIPDTLIEVDKEGKHKITPVSRHITGIEEHEEEGIVIRVMIPPKDARHRVKFVQYNTRQFTEETLANILKLAIRYI